MTCTHTGEKDSEDVDGRDAMSSPNSGLGGTGDKWRRDTGRRKSVLLTAYYYAKCLPETYVYILLCIGRNNNGYLVFDMYNDR